MNIPEGDEAQSQVFIRRKAKSEPKMKRHKKKVIPIPGRVPSIVVMPKKEKIFITPDKTTCLECECFPKEDPWLRNKKLLECQKSPLTLYEYAAAVVDQLKFPEAFKWSMYSVAEWIGYDLHLPEYEVCKNAASNNIKPPLSLEYAQKIVSSLNGIWDIVVTLIREHESPLSNQGRNDPCLNPDAGTSSCNNHEKKQEEMNSEGNPKEISAKNASNVCNKSTMNSDNYGDNIKRKDISCGTLKGKRYHNRKGKVGAKKSRKSSDNNTTGEVHVNTVIFVAEKDVKKVVSTSPNANGEKSECIQSLKRKFSTDNVTSKKRRLVEVVAQKIDNNYVSNKVNGKPDENDGGFGVEIDSKICEEVDLSDDTHQQAMTSENLNKTEEGNKSRDIIEISDDEDNSKKSENKGTTVKVCDAENKKTNGDIDGNTLDKLRIRNDIATKPARSMLKDVFISTNQSISSLAPSTFPVSKSKPEKSSSQVASTPVKPGTSNLSDQKPIVSSSHVTTPLNLPISKNTEILVTSRSSVPRHSAPSLISQNSLAHTSLSKPSPQGSTLSPGTIIPWQSYSMNHLPSSTRSKIPVFSSPGPIPVADKPSVPTVNQRKYLSTLPKLAQILSQLPTSTLPRCDSQVAMQPAPSSTSFTAQKPFEAPSHINTPLNLPLLRSELSVKSISSLQRSSTQSHIASFRRERTRSSSLAEGSIHPHQPPKTWHTPVTLTSEIPSQTISNTFVQGSSPAASSFKAYSCKPRSIALAHSIISSTPELSITSKSPVQKLIPAQTVQASSPAPALLIPTNSFDSLTVFRERVTPPTYALINQQVTRPSMLYMPNRPPVPTIPIHPEIVQLARPNLLPGATLDVSMRGNPSLNDIHVIIL